MNHDHEVVYIIGGARVRPPRRTPRTGPLETNRSGELARILETLGISQFLEIELETVLRLGVVIGRDPEVARSFVADEEENDNDTVRRKSTLGHRRGDPGKDLWPVPAAQAA